MASNLPQGLVALFIGATSGIGQSALQHLAAQANSARIYSVARPQTVPAHEKFLDSLRESNTSSTFNLITADVSLVSEVDKIANFIKEKETKLDVLLLSTGFMAYEGRKDTSEGLEPSVSTRYYSRIRAAQQLLPLLNNAEHPRIVSVLAGGLEGPINESDLDLKDPANWSFWNAAVHSTTLGTLTLERFAQQNPKLSIVHWFPGPVETPGLARARKFGQNLPPNPASQEEAGEIAARLATSKKFDVQKGDAKKSGGGIFLVNPKGESTDNEKVLADYRSRGVDEKVWKFTEEVFEGIFGKTGTAEKSEL